MAEYHICCPSVEAQKEILFNSQVYAQGLRKGADGDRSLNMPDIFVTAAVA